MTIKGQQAMSNKTFTVTITGDRKLMEQIRGEIPLRAKQVHKNRKDKRNDKWWNDPRKWDQE